MDERRKERQYEIGRREKAEKAAATGFLQNTVDSKQFLTGGDLDPVINANLQEAERKGLELVASGVTDSSQIYQALYPIMQNVVKYKSAAKQISGQIEQSIKDLKDGGGGASYDYAKLAEAARQKAFYTNGKLNPDGVDPSKNYVMDVIKETPELVTTGDGIGEYIDKAKMVTESDTFTVYDEKGGRTKKQLKLTRPEFMVAEYETTPDGEKVFTGNAPKYDLAIDEKEQAIMADFADGTGTKVKGQVRLLDEELYDQISKQKGGIADYLRGQVNLALKEHKQETGEDLSIRSAKAKVFARALLYTELNGRGKSMTSKDVVPYQPSAAEAAMNVKKENQGFITGLAGAIAGAQQGARNDANMDPEYAAFLVEQDKKKKQNTQDVKETTEGDAKKEKNYKEKSDKWRNNNDTTGYSDTNKYYQGKKVDGQTIKDVTGNTVSRIFGNKRFVVTLEGADGKDVKKEFDTKGEMFKFLDKADGGAAPAETKPAVGGTKTNKLSKKYGLD